VLQWAHANGCPWNEYVCRNAAANGRLAVLQWAHANGCPLGSLTITGAREMWEAWSKEVPVAEFEDVVEWLRANGCPEGEEMSGSEGGDDMTDAEDGDDSESDPE
jgi:hypothetical protein